MRRTVIFFLILVPTHMIAAQTPADSALNKFFQDYLDADAKRHPVDASRLGDYRYADRMNDLSPEARQDDVAFTKKILARLDKEIEYKTLTRASQIDYEIFRTSLVYSLWLAENMHTFEEDPRAWNDYLVDSVFMLLAQSTLEKATAIRYAAARMEAIPRVVANAKASLKKPLLPHLETAIKQNRGAIAFYENGIYQMTGETPQLSVLAQPAKAAVTALREHQKFLESLRGEAHGQWRLGLDKFNKKLELELDAGLTAAEVIRAAEEEKVRVVRDMYVIARQLWCTSFPGVPLPPDDELGRRETIHKVLALLGTHHSTPESVVADVRATVTDLKAFIKKRNILPLPDPDKCDIIEMPEFQRGNSTAYLNPAPPLDPKAKSFYAVSPPPKDWDAHRIETYFAEYNHSMLKILSIHEGYPGHYVQLEYANRHPSLIRRVQQSGVFAEGWAVYTEQMMLDEGYAKGDLPVRLHQLKFYLRAVINAILDHHMHCDNMTDEDALKLLMHDGFQSEAEAVGKIIRAKQSSVQLSTYFVGRTAFYRLRQRLSRELGAAFDLSTFHVAVLAHGTLPVKYLPELVATQLKPAKK